MLEADDSRTRSDAFVPALPGSALPEHEITGSSYQSGIFLFAIHFHSLAHAQTPSLLAAASHLP